MRQVTITADDSQGQSNYFSFTKTSGFVSKWFVTRVLLPSYVLAQIRKCNGMNANV